MSLETPSWGPNSGLSSAAENPVSIVEMTRIELRKMTDTRAGFWLLIVVGLLSLLVVGGVVTVAVLNSEETVTFAQFLEFSTVAQQLLIPVLGILLITSEWTQRTTLVTFALSPSRLRVLVAKALAGLVLAMGVYAVDVVLSLIGTVVIGQAGTIGLEGWWGPGLTLALGMLQGIAFGLLLLNSAAAIVLYYVLPIVVGIVFSVVPRLLPAAPWVDGSAFLALSNGSIDTGREAAQLTTNLLLWLILPAALGTLRVLRAEIK